MTLRSARESENHGNSRGASRSDTHPKVEPRIQGRREKDKKALREGARVRGEGTLTRRSNRAVATGEEVCATTVVSVSEGDLEALDERAAIMEFDGGLARQQAERAAVENVRPVVALTPGLATNHPTGISIELSAEPESMIANDPRLEPFVEALAALLWKDIRRAFAALPSQSSPIRTSPRHPIGTRKP